MDRRRIEWVADMTTKTKSAPLLLAWLLTHKGETIGLTRDGPTLAWQSDIPQLAKDAEKFVPVGEIPEWGGNPAAWAIGELSRWIPGTTGVCGSNMPPIEMQTEQASLVIDGQKKYGRRIDDGDDTPERYAARPDKMRLYVYKDDDEESSIPLGSREQWEGFATWAAEKGGELGRLAIEGHTDAFRTYDAITAVGNELRTAKVPEQYQAIADVIRDAASGKGVEGLLVSVED